MLFDQNNAVNGSAAPTTIVEDTLSLIPVAGAVKLATWGIGKVGGKLGLGKADDVLNWGSSLSKVDPPKGKTFDEVVHRYDDHEYLDTSWKQTQHNIDADYRYTGEGQGGVYAGTTQQTAYKEVTYDRQLGKKVPSQQNVKLNNVLDLTDPKVRKQIGVDMKDITATGKGAYTKTQQIGKWAKDNGYDGILAPSARNHDGSNIVILRHD